MKQHIFISLIILQLTACQSKSDKQLAFAFECAGDNSVELGKVLDHYKDDSLKLKAAQFLITNLPGYEGYDRILIQELQPIYEKHIRISEKYNWGNPSGWRKEIKDMWEKEQQHVNINKYPMIPDIKIIKADWLIKEIDLALQAWKENAYTKDAPFEDFCNYILPYRFTDQYCLDSYRQLFYNRHHGFFSKKTDDFRVLTDSLHVKYSFLTHSVGFGASIPICDIATYEKIKRGICRDQTRFNSLLMSALGMPVAIDFTPAWGNRTNGHSWNVLIMDGKTYPFEPFWDKDRWKYDKIYNNESTDLIAHKFRLPKVFRNTFEFRLEDGPVTDKNENRKDIPDLFKNLRMKDVSSQYFKTTDIQLDITENIPEDTQYCYLCVYNPQNMDWIPVQWGKIEKKKVTFKDMGRDIVYLPAFFKDGRVIPAAPVFRLEQDGTSKILKPNNQKQDITVTAVNSLSVRYRKFITGAKIIGINDLQDKKAQEVLHVIGDTIDPSTNKVLLHTTKQYCYLRIVLPQDTIALNEITLFEQKGEQCFQIPDVKPYAEVDTSLYNQLGSIVDNLSGTGYFGPFFSKEGKNEGILLDLGKPCTVHSLSFIPFAKSFVNTGANFKLYYWDQNRWIEAQTMEGKADFITFSQISVGALYVIKGSIPIEDPYYKERIFTYENGIQYWW